MRVVRNPDGSSSVICSTLSAPRENQAGRSEVYGWAADTFIQQQEDRQDVRRRAYEAPSPEERARCREAVLKTPPPTYEGCLRYSRQVRLRREVDFRSTLLDG